jgi:hypothetical protein
VEAKLEEKPAQGEQAHDSLVRIELRIARRADEFAQARNTAATVDSDREAWRRAEAEVLGRMEAGFFHAAPG